MHWEVDKKVPLQSVWVSLALHVIVVGMACFCAQVKPLESSAVGGTTLTISGLVRQEDLAEQLRMQAVERVGDEQTKLSSNAERMPAKPEESVPTSAIPRKPSAVTVVAKPALQNRKAPPIRQFVEKKLVAKQASVKNVLSQATKVQSGKPRTAEVVHKALGHKIGQSSLSAKDTRQTVDGGGARAAQSSNAQKLSVQAVKGAAQAVSKKVSAQPAKLHAKSEIHKPQPLAVKAVDTAQKKSVSQQQKVQDAEKKRLLAEQEKRRLHAQKLAKEKEEKERKRLEAQRLAKEKAEKAQRLAKEKERKRLEVERLAKEKAERDRKIAAEKLADSRLLAEYSQRIVEKLRGFYALPPGLEGQMKTVLLVDLDDKGGVKNVAVKKTSGNEHHDRAAVAAILKASPLPLPTKENVRAQFKQFDITISPQVLEGR